MVIGVFVDSDKPVVKAGIAWDQAVQTPNFILDTGFTGDLVVPASIATDLGLKIDGVMTVSLAGTKSEKRPTATAIALMEGQRLYVTVIIIEEGWPLLGISFMEKFKYRALIDCRNKTVQLEGV